MYYEGYPKFEEDCIEKICDKFADGYNFELQITEAAIERDDMRIAQKWMALHQKRLKDKVNSNNDHKKRQFECCYDKVCEFFNQFDKRTILFSRWVELDVKEIHELGYMFHKIKNQKVKGNNKL